MRRQSRQNGRDTRTPRDSLHSVGLLSRLMKSIQQEASVADRISQPAERLTKLEPGQPVSQPACLPARGQPVSQSASQAGRQAASQPASQQPVSQGAWQPASQPGSQTARQPASQTASQPASQPASQSMRLFFLALLCSTSPPAETRLTVYRRSQLLLGQKPGLGWLTAVLPPWAFWPNVVSAF